MIAIWMAVPDFRFGQLMSNFFAWIAARQYTDPFYLEDEDFFRLMRRYLELAHGIRIHDMEYEKWCQS